MKYSLTSPSFSVNSPPPKQSWACRECATRKQREVITSLLPSPPAAPPSAARQSAAGLPCPQSRHRTPPASPSPGLACNKRFNGQGRGAVHHTHAVHRVGGALKTLRAGGAARKILGSFATAPSPNTRQPGEPAQLGAAPSPSPEQHPALELKGATAKRCTHRAISGGFTSVPSSNTGTSMRLPRVTSWSMAAAMTGVEKP